MKRECLQQQCVLLIFKCSTPPVLLVALQPRALGWVAGSCSCPWSSEAGSPWYRCFLPPRVCRPSMFALGLDWEHWRTHWRGQPLPIQMSPRFDRQQGCKGGSCHGSKWKTLYGSCLMWGKGRIRDTRTQKEYSRQMKPRHISFGGNEGWFDLTTWGYRLEHIDYNAFSTF